MNEPFCRRRFLTLSTAGLVTAAGCVEDGGDDGFQPGDGNPDTDDEVTEGGPSNQPSRDPAFALQHGNNEPFTRLPIYNGWNSVQYREHPNTRAVRVEVGPSAITATFNSMKLNRDIELSADYKSQDGSIKRTDTVTLSPESDSFKTYEVEIHINGRDLPRNKKGVVKLIAADTHEDSQGHIILKEHRFIAIPYENSRGASIKWVNAEALNFNYASGDISTPTKLYSEEDANQNEFTRFFALAHPVKQGKIIGGYSTIPREMYAEYRKNKKSMEWRENHHPGSYMYHADDFEMFTSLTNSFTDSLDANNITDHYDRLQKLAFLVGSMPYRRDRIKDNQVKTLHHGGGDCTEVTTLFLALINTSAFNHTQGAMIHCKLAEYGDHAIIGIDERHIGNPPNPDDINWFRPSQEMQDHGAPDRCYALTELTQPRRIGGFNDEKNEIIAIMDTTNLDVTPQLRDGPG